MLFSSSRVCSWCQGDMTTAISCVVDAVRRDGRLIPMIPYGAEPGGPVRADRCGDCGVFRGGWHHPGCDLQRCPACLGQLLSCDCLCDDEFDDEAFDDEFDDEFDDDEDVLTEPLGVDGNGLLTERMWLGDQEVIVHRGDYPESDITTVHGIRCTTALRTVIDIAPDVPASHLDEIVEDCLERGMFTVDEAWRRLAEPDMADLRGAELLRRALPPSAA